MDIALIGVGKIALAQHVPALAASPDWRLAATVSHEGEVPDVPAYTDFDLFLAERPDIRVVSLCLPPVPRFDYAMKALRAGRHVMLEKPPCATLAECHALQAEAEARGLTIFATWHSREADQVAAAKAWLAGKKLLSLHVDWREDVRRWHPGQDWIFEPGGMGVFDPGINAFSILTEILQGELQLREAQLETPENRQAPIGATLRFHHASGAAITADLDFRKEGEQIWDITAVTDAGTMRLSEGGARLFVEGQDHGETQALAGEYPRLYARMAELLRAGQIDMDLRPMTLVADAFLLGRRVSCAPFHF